jgi:hypothetical protein
MGGLGRELEGFEKGRKKEEIQVKVVYYDSMDASKDKGCEEENAVVRGYMYSLGHITSLFVKV